MSSAFTSWSDFLAMGGYAFYVWLAVALTILPLAALAALVAHSAILHRVILRDIARQRAREARRRAAREAI
ncbi:TPA: heme exporter protein CcmD [Klebsiella michiganensis]|nr:heme exporter protein CcmD [Klebsiella michiganensis]